MKLPLIMEDDITNLRLIAVKNGTKTSVYVFNLQESQRKCSYGEDNRHDLNLDISDQQVHTDIRSH